MGTNKRYLIIGIVVVFLLIGIVGFVIKRNQIPNSAINQPSPTEEVIPTIDSSVVVDLISLSTGREVQLTIGKIPSGTSTIDYELSYQTAKQGLQGVIGTITLNKESDYKKNLTLGTCSSGTCIYHQVIGKINLTLKFNGSYGERIFEKDFEI